MTKTKLFPRQNFFENYKDAACDIVIKYQLLFVYDKIITFYFALSSKTGLS